MIAISIFIAGLLVSHSLGRIASALEKIASR